MKSLKKHLESIRHYSFPKTRALEHELNEVREAHAAVSADLEKVREELQRTHEGDAQLIADLQQRLKDAESEHSNALERVAQLQHSLTDTEQSQKSTEEKLGSLETMLDEERNDARVRVELLEHSLADAEKSRQSTEEHVAALGATLEEERSSAGARVEQLERLLADAEQSQKTTNEHVASLETMLEEEHKRHEANMQATEARQTQMQAEQQTQLTRQTEMANTFHRVSTRLFESQQEGNKKQRYLLLQLMIVAGVLFVTATLIGVLFMQGTQNGSQELVAVEQNLDDMRGFIKRYIDNQDTVLNELALTLDRKTSADQILLGGKPLQLELLTQGTDTQRQETLTFTPDIRDLQASLMVLGFDLGMSKPNGELGIKTRRALQEFRQYYLPQTTAEDEHISEALMVLILNSADLVRADAARFRMDSDVLAAIRLGSMRTGVDFSFLMELARVESYFNPTARAPKSLATGLYQFKSPDWLEAIRTFGANYGLQDYVTRLALIDDQGYEQQPIIYDPQQREVLALRLNPRLSALLMAETIKSNLQSLPEMTGREPERTDLYLSHFLGLDGAVTFLKALDEEPTAIAGGLFPEAAADNPGVFVNRLRQPRTVAGVFQWFDRKFNTARYDDPDP